MFANSESQGMSASYLNISFLRLHVGATGCQISDLCLKLQCWSMFVSANLRSWLRPLLPCRQALWKAGILILLIHYGLATVENAYLPTTALTFLSSISCKRVFLLASRFSFDIPHCNGTFFTTESMRTYVGFSLLTTFIFQFLRKLYV